MLVADNAGVGPRGSFSLGDPIVAGTWRPTKHFASARGAVRIGKDGQGGEREDPCPVVAAVLAASHEPSGGQLIREAEGTYD